MVSLTISMECNIFPLRRIYTLPTTPNPLCTQQLLLVDIWGHDKVDVPLIREGRSHYMMHVPRLPEESHPSVLRGGKIPVSIRGVSNIEGIIYCTSQEYVSMTLPKLFDALMSTA